MSGILFCLFLISGCFFLGMILAFLKFQRPGVYPPKRILKQRMIVLGSGGLISMLLSLFLLMVIR